MDEAKNGWAHAPLHRFKAGAVMVTAATYQKALLFDTPEKRFRLQRALIGTLKAHHWELQAWAVMANHYHFVAYVPETDRRDDMMRALHAETATWLNEQDATPGRRVWYQYWDTNLTNPKSYYARLNYVLHNPEKHGLVKNALEYPWCSMAWFRAGAETAFQKTVFSFKCDKINVFDDFD